VISLSHIQHIFVARCPVDMRKQANGLARVVETHLGRDPLSGDVFIFGNRQGSILKILMWDLSGYWVASKRLEQGRFGFGKRRGNRDAQGCLAVSVAEAMNIIEGIDVHKAAYSQHYGYNPLTKESNKNQ